MRHKSDIRLVEKPVGGHTAKECRRDYGHTSGPIATILNHRWGKTVGRVNARVTKSTAANVQATTAGASARPLLILYGHCAGLFNAYVGQFDNAPAERFLSADAVRQIVASGFF